MTKIVFRYNLVKKDILLNIYDIIADLNNLKLQIERLDIPNDFKYLQYLKSLNSKIDNYKNIYSNFVDNIDEFNKNLEYELNDLFVNLENIKNIDN